MNNGLSKKEKKAVSKAITAKLELLGVKDEITFIPSGKKIKVPVIENNQIKVQDGLPVMQELDVPLAMNALRRTVRNLRNAPIEQIEAFLSLPVPEQNVTESVETTGNNGTQLQE